MKNIVHALALSLLVLLPWSAQATMIEFRDMRCPVGGEPISLPVARSMFLSGMDLDFKRYGPGLELLNAYTECPMNGFVVFKTDFTPQEVDVLRAYIASEEFQAARQEGTNYRAYLLKKRLGTYSDAELGHTLLRATWQAEGFWQYRRYARQALVYYERESERLRGESTDEAFHAMHIRGELSRRLMRFWDAYWAFDHQRTRPGIEDSPYRSYAELETWAIRLMWAGPLHAQTDSPLKSLGVSMLVWVVKKFPPTAGLAQEPY